MVTFYELDNNGKPTNPVLFLDTLKVSTIEQTGETSEQKGGKGNTTLIMWDYNKEINVTLEDALFSAKSMAIMFGNGKIKKIAKAGTSAGDLSEKQLIMKTVVHTPTKDGQLYGKKKSSGADLYWEAPNGELCKIVNARYFDEKGSEILTPSSTTLLAGSKYFCTFDIQVKEGTDAVIEISANTFPGTWTNIMSALAGNKIMLNYLVNCWKPYK